MKKDVALVFVTIDRPDAAQRLVFSIRERSPISPSTSPIRPSRAR